MPTLERGLKRLERLNRLDRLKNLATARLHRKPRVNVQPAKNTTPQLDLTDAVTRFLERQKSPFTRDNIDTSAASTPIFDSMPPMPQMPDLSPRKPVETSLALGNVFINNIGTAHLPKMTEEVTADIPHEATAEERENEIVYENSLLRNAAVNGFSLAVPLEYRLDDKAQIVAVDMHEVLAEIALDNTKHANPGNDTIELWVTTDKNNRPLSPSVNQQRMEYIGFRLGQLGRKPEDLFHFVQELLSDQRAIPVVTEMIRSSRTLEGFDARFRAFRQNNDTNH